MVCADSCAPLAIYEISQQPCSLSANANRLELAPLLCLLSSINASLVHISSHSSGNIKRSRPSYSSTPNKKFFTPVAQLVAIANPNLGLRTSRKAEASSDDKFTFKHQSCPENLYRRLWNIAESITVRIKVLEHLDQEYSRSNRSSTNEPILANNEAERSLYKIMEAALARVSVLERGGTYLTVLHSKHQMELSVS